MTSCKYCGSLEIHFDESRGETYCTQCGSVLEENQIVESLSFTETFNGSIKAVGQFIPSSKICGGFLSSYSARKSHDFILQRGYTNIQRIADRLKLPIQLIDSAQRIYLMGLQRGFVIGRVNNHVAAACLYISCRRDKSPQLLIDFSDVLVTPVKTLGKIFVKLSQILHIQIPTIDPSLFMERFASQMNLEDKTQTVAQTGIRLIQAMMRDWICTGRRPTGLCGAALLIAARFHGFKINSEDIANIIRMSSSTLTKRLAEFKKTSAAKLKASEFNVVDLTSLPILNGPPCVLKKKLKDLKRKKKILELNSNDTSLSTCFLNETSSELSVPLGDEPYNDKNVQYSPYSLVYPPYNIKIKASQDEICQEIPSSHEISSLAYKLVGSIESQLSSTKNDGLSSCEPTNENSVDNESNEFTNDDPIRSLLENVKNKAMELLCDEVVTSSKKYPTFDDNYSCDSTKACSQTDSFSDIEADNNSIKEYISEPDTHSIDEDSLSDISDTEIDNLILSPEERHAKMLIWDELMKDIMPDVHRRHITQKQKDTKTDKPSKRQKKNSFLLSLQSPPNVPVDQVNYQGSTPVLSGLTNCSNNLFSESLCSTNSNVLNSSENTNSILPFSESTHFLTSIFT